MQFVNLNRQYQAYKSEIKAAIDQVLERGDYILGQEVNQFEREFKQYLNVSFAVACANGTDALLLSLAAAGVKKGDEVLVPAFTFIASVSQILMLGAKPVFVDVEEDTFNIDPNDLETKITNKTKAAIVVHLYGQMADIRQIKQICEQNNLKLIEDTAQSFGATYKNQQAGTFGDFGTFSFFPAKNLGAYGDAGMVVTNNKEAAKQLKMLRFHGHSKKYYSELLGFNSRLDTIQAAILRVKLKHFVEELKHRRQAAEYYNKNFKSNQIISKPIEKPEYKHSYNYYTLRVKNRDELQKLLKEHDIPSMVYYPLPCHQQVMMQQFDLDVVELPVTEKLTQEVISLPIDGFIKQKEQDEIISLVNEFKS